MLDLREFASATKGLKFDVITTSDAAKRSRLPKALTSSEDSQILSGLVHRLLENRAETALVSTTISSLATQRPNMEGSQPNDTQLRRVILEALSGSSCGVETQPTDGDVQRDKVKGVEKADEVQTEDEDQRAKVKGAEEADEVQTEDEGQRDRVKGKGVKKADEVQRLAEDEVQRDKVKGVEKADELQTEEVQRVKVKVEIGPASNSPCNFASASRGAYFAGLVFG